MNCPVFFAVVAFLSFAFIHVPSVSVLWYPFLFSVFVGCHVSVSPLLSLQFCPLFFATCSYFRTISISFFVALLQSKLCLLFPNVTILYLFFPFFFRVTFFLSPFLLYFFTGVCKAGIYIFSGQAAHGERPAGRSKAPAVKRSERVRH